MIEQETESPKKAQKLKRLQTLRQMSMVFKEELLEEEVEEKKEEAPIVEEPAVENLDEETLRKAMDTSLLMTSGDVTRENFERLKHKVIQIDSDILTFN